MTRMIVFITKNKKCYSGIIKYIHMFNYCCYTHAESYHRVRQYLFLGFPLHTFSITKTPLSLSLKRKWLKVSSIYFLISHYIKFNPLHDAPSIFLSLTHSIASLLHLKPTSLFIFIQILISHFPPLPNYNQKWKVPLRSVFFFYSPRTFLLFCFNCYGLY